MKPLVMVFAMHDSWTNPMSTRRSQWLATRELIDEAVPKGTLKAQIGAPEQLRDDEWRCRFRIEGLDKGKVHYAHGMDAIQALINTVESMARLIRESERQLTWMGGEPGDSGFRRQVPIYLGPKFASRIESMIEREVQNTVKRLARKTRSKLKSNGNVSQ